MHFDIKEIVAAYAARIKPTETQKKLAELRAEVCNECENCVEHTIADKVVSNCSVCGCFIGGKIYTYKEGACPEGKWDEIDSKFRTTNALKVLKDSKNSLI